MIVFQNNILTINLKTQTREVLFSPQNFFSDEEGRFWSHRVESTLIITDQEGNLLPKDQWYWKAPYPVIIEHNADGQKFYWDANDKGGYSPRE